MVPDRMTPDESSRLARLEEHYIRLDERQKADHANLVELDSDVRMFGTSIAELKSDVRELRLLLTTEIRTITTSIDGKVGKALWGYAAGGIGAASGVAAAVGAILKMTGAL